MRLILVRHGQTPSNVSGAIDTGPPGPGLTTLGELQARAVPQALADQDIAGIYASTLVRTQFTATPLSRRRGIGVRIRAGLEEIEAGELEMQADSISVGAYRDSVAQWVRGDLAHSGPSGRTGHEFYARYDAAIDDIAAAHQPDDTVVVFSHGAAIRVYAALAGGLDPRMATELTLMNTGAAFLEGDSDSGWTLTRWSSEPLGGVVLEDRLAHDVTGDLVDDFAIHN